MILSIRRAPCPKRAISFVREISLIGMYVLEYRFFLDRYKSLNCCYKAIHVDIQLDGRMGDIALEAIEM